MEIPKEVRAVVENLKKNTFEAFVVGGCVRDLLRGVDPQDWDIATNAKPEEVQKIFPDNFYENKFFTVTVRTESKDPKLKEIEITTYRSDTGSADRRHPEEVAYAKTIGEDLSRRDFTVNAIALKLGTKNELIDPFQGQKDLKEKLIRAVGNPSERFQEDALRMMRAVRFFATLSAQGGPALGWSIEKDTKKAIQENSLLLKEISGERIRDELIKIINSERAMEGVEELRETKLLAFIIPELEEGYGVGQNKHHIFTVWEHNMKALQYAVSQKWDFDVRFASLLHDVAKPRVKQGDGKDSTFYNHEVVGGSMAKKILERLKFPRAQIERISKLVRCHLFYYNVDEVTDASVRRLLVKVGPQDMEALLQVRMADRIGSGVPKAEPYKLRHLRYAIEKVSQDPISAKMIKINGNEIIKLLGIEPGPRVGWILDVLLGEVLENPKKNDTSILTKRVQELGKLADNELSELAKVAKQERENVETKRDEMTKAKYWIQ